MTSAHEPRSDSLPLLPVDRPKARHRRRAARKGVAEKIAREQYADHGPLREGPRPAFSARRVKHTKIAKRGAFRLLRQIVYQLEPSAGAGLRPVFLGRQPARPGSGLERQPPASLPPGQRSAGPLDHGRCQQTATCCGLRRDLQPARQPARSADATRRHGHGEADRFDADPARQAVRLGQIQRAHPRPEDAVVFDPKADCPGILDITDANVNDAQIGRTVTIEQGATYVFDKGYCHYGWWTAIADPRRGLPHPTQDQYAPRPRRRAPHRAGARR